MFLAFWLSIKVLPFVFSIYFTYLTGYNIVFKIDKIFYEKAIHLFLTERLPGQYDVCSNTVNKTHRQNNEGKDSEKLNYKLSLFFKKYGIDCISSSEGNGIILSPSGYDQPLLFYFEHGASKNEFEGRGEIIDEHWISLP